MSKAYDAAILVSLPWCTKSDTAEACTDEFQGKSVAAYPWVSFYHCAKAKQGRPFQMQRWSTAFDLTTQTATSVSAMVDGRWSVMVTSHPFHRLSL
jgi:hypothetical protein